MAHQDTLDIEALRALGGYWYLATPYSKYSEGIEAAFIEASRAAAWLTRNRIGVFCPISHTHPIAVYGDIDPLSHEIWLPADTPLMAGASGLIVCMMRGWETSFGITHERGVFEEAGKPVFFMEWPRKDSAQRVGKCPP